MFLTAVAVGIGRGVCVSVSVSVVGSELGWFFNTASVRSPPNDDEVPGKGNTRSASRFRGPGGSIGLLSWLSNVVGMYRAVGGNVVALWLLAIGFPPDSV